MSWGKGQQVNNGRYEILDRIGTGGFGVTYKAIDLKHPTPNSIVAIKTLNEKRQRQANFEQLQENFLNEAMALAKCSHPHVIRVDRVFPDGQIWAMVMDYIEGESLEDYLIDRGKLPETKAVEIIQKIGGAVSYVHAQRLLHRDIKPANILIKPNGEPILIDFGLAREFVAGIARSMTSDRTPHYSPPEQAERRGDFQPPLDIYALAATLYTCVTGDLPPLAEIRMVRDSLIPPQQLNSGISDRVNQAILIGMALKPEDRSSTVVKWLELLLPKPTPAAKPSPPAPTPPATFNRQKFQFQTAKLEIFTYKMGFDGQGKEKTEAKITRMSGEAEYSREDLGNDVKLDMVYIPAGSFGMGSTELGLEQPIHRVKLASFYMGKYPITQQQYRAIVGANPSVFKRDNRPVEGVNWWEAIEFCLKLSQRTGKKYTLPSESQWEYAARAGTSTPFYYGETVSTDLANYKGNHTYGKGSKDRDREQTTDVGSFPANGWGLYDMHGNVWEWCLDEWVDNYNGAPTDGSARGDTLSQYEKPLRGGSWSSISQACRSAGRHGWLASRPYNDIGFRVVFPQTL